MKLYYSPGACSLSSHIALHEAGVPHEIVRVDLRSHQTATGEDYHAINPKGSVPLLEIAPGVSLTENAAILQYVADHFAPALAPANGTLERARLQEMLSFIGADYHKLYSPLFRPDVTQDWKQASRVMLARRHAYLESLLADGRPFILGDSFSIADAYLYTVTSWSSRVDVSLEAYPHLGAHMERIAARPAVEAALKAEAGGN